MLSLLVQILPVLRVVKYELLERGFWDGDAAYVEVC